MEEKYMVNDVLNQVNSSLTTYATSISQTENLQLRKALQKIRDNCETFQYDLFNLATEKGFYKPAQQANQREIKTVKSQFASE